LIAAGAMLIQKTPLLRRGAIQHRRRMAGVAEREVIGRGEKCGHQCSREAPIAEQRGELLIHRLHEAGLIDLVDVPPHERAELRRHMRHRTMARDIGDAFYDYDKSDVREDARNTLQRNADTLKTIFREFSGGTVAIEGHCDERGTQAYNLVLGEKRARSAKRYLEDLGVPTSRLKTTSYGEMRPFCKERDESCYQQNRRAHFAIQ